MGTQFQRIRFNTHEAGEAVDGFEASSRLRKSPNSRTTNHGRFDEALYWPWSARSKRLHKLNSVTWIGTHSGKFIVPRMHKAKFKDSVIEERALYVMMGRLVLLHPERRGVFSTCSGSSIDYVIPCRESWKPKIFIFNYIWSLGNDEREHLWILARLIKFKHTQLCMPKTSADHLSHWFQM